MPKSPEQVREDNRKRKQKQREKEAIRYSELGIEDIKFEILRGTRECLSKLKADHGYDEGREGDAELLTHAIHSLANRDKSQAAEILQIPVPPQKTA